MATAISTHYIQVKTCFNTLPYVLKFIQSALSMRHLFEWPKMRNCFCADWPLWWVWLQMKEKEQPTLFTGSNGGALLQVIAFLTEWSLLKDSLSNVGMALRDVVCCIDLRTSNAPKSSCGRACGRACGCLVRGGGRAPASQGVQKAKKKL
jgi:hypothetical protein